MVREMQPGDHRLIAWLVPAGDEVPAADELRAHLGRLLPEHQIPALFLPLDVLPLTASGKLDRTTLARTELPDQLLRPQLAAGFTAPRTSLERHLAEIWQRLLGLDQVGVHDNFFDLGGHSLLATHVQAEIAAELGVELELLEIFEHPTVAGLARLLEEG